MTYTYIPNFDVSGGVSSFVVGGEVSEYDTAGMAGFGPHVMKAAAVYILEKSRDGRVASCERQFTRQLLNRRDHAR
jgi:hypothetical protein